MTEKELNLAENIRRFSDEIPHIGRGSRSRSSEIDYSRRPSSRTDLTADNDRNSRAEILALLTDEWLRTGEVHKLLGRQTSHSVARYLISLLTSRQIEGAFVGGVAVYRRKQAAS